MLRFLFLVFGLAVGVATVQAMPFNRVQTGLVVPVAAGCGLGVHRALYNGCYPIYPSNYKIYKNPYFVGYYADYYPGYPRGYYSGPGRLRIVNRGGCDGGTLHRICNVYGVCWAVCD